MVALATVVLAPVVEEIFFRGLLLKALARLFTPPGPGVTRARGTGVVLAVLVALWRAMRISTGAEGALRRGTSAAGRTVSDDIIAGRHKS